MLHTLKSLKSIVEWSKENGRYPSSVLRLYAYPRKDSEFHRFNSPFVKVIDKLVDRYDIPVSQALVVVLNGWKSIPLCKECGKEPVSYYGGKYHDYCSRRCAFDSTDRTLSIQKTMLERYGVKNYCQIDSVKEAAMRGVKSDECKQKRISTNLERYGHKSSFSNKRVQEKFLKTVEDKYGSVSNMIKSGEAKRIATSFDRYGVDNPLKNKSVKDKVKRTLLSNYGVDHPMKSKKIQKKIRKTMNSKYGVDYPMQSEEVRGKCVETWRNNYGFDHPMHDPKVFSKMVRSSLETKSVEIDGVEFKELQGYEPDAIKYLVKEFGYRAEEIIAHPRKSFSWIDKKEKEHFYHPDIKIRGKKHIIEVKSKWTFNGTSWHSDTNKLKRRAVREAGYKFSFLIMPRNYKKEEPVWITRDAI